MRKRLLSAVLAALVLIAFTACGQKKTEGVDKKAIEQLQTALNSQPQYEKVDISFGGELAMNRGAQAMNFTADAQMKVNLKDKTNIEMGMNGSALFAGLGADNQNMTVDMYMKDQWVYVNYMGIKQKTKIPATALSQIEENQAKSEVKLDASQFSKFVFADREGDDIGYEMELDTQKEDGIVKTLEAQLNLLIGKNSEDVNASVEVKGIKMHVTTDKDGALKDGNIEIQVRVNSQDLSLDATATMNVKINQTGDGVTITPPKDLGSYKETTSSSGLPSLL